jgi:hypothetical protein
MWILRETVQPQHQSRNVENNGCFCMWRGKEGHLEFVEWCVPTAMYRTSLNKESHFFYSLLPKWERMESRKRKTAVPRGSWDVREDENSEHNRKSLIIPSCTCIWAKSKCWVSIEQLLQAWSPMPYNEACVWFTQAYGSWLHSFQSIMSRSLQSAISDSVKPQWQWMCEEENTLVSLPGRKTWRGRGCESTITFRINTHKKKTSY